MCQPPWGEELNAVEEYPILEDPGIQDIQGMPTVLCNHNRIVFEEMSSWTALTMHLGIKTTFLTKYMKANIF